MFQHAFCFNHLAVKIKELRKPISNKAGVCNRFYSILIYWANLNITNFDFSYTWLIL